MTEGGFRYARTECGGFTETLVAEGLTAGGRRWAALHRECKDQEGHEGHEYAVLVDASDNWTRYCRSFAVGSKAFFDALRDLQPARRRWEQMPSWQNVSPSLWDNGYGRCFYAFVPVIAYVDSADLMRAAAAGMDTPQTLDWAAEAEKVAATVDEIAAAASGLAPADAPDAGDF